jgi:S-adenosyl methyltransferase
VASVPQPAIISPHRLPPGIDTSVVHPARRYNYFLGGKYNFTADREAGDAVIAEYPFIRTASSRGWSAPSRRAATWCSRTLRAT